MYCSYIGLLIHVDVSLKCIEFFLWQERIFFFATSREMFIVSDVHFSLRHETSSFLALHFLQNPLGLFSWIYDVVEKVEWLFQYDISNDIVFILQNVWFSDFFFFSKYYILCLWLISSNNIAQNIWNSNVKLLIFLFWK